MFIVCVRSREYGRGLLEDVEDVLGCEAGDAWSGGKDGADGVAGARGDGGGAAGLLEGGREGRVVFG